MNMNRIAPRAVAPVLSAALAVLLGLAAAIAPPRARAADLAPQDLITPEALAALRERTVLVAGASGRNGRVVLRQLAALGVRARAMTRDPEAARREIGAGFDWVAGDVTRPETLAAAVKDVDVVISAVATAMPVGANRPEEVDFAGTVNLSKAARAAGATRFVIITSSVSGKKDHFLNYIGGDVLIWKKRAEEALISSGLEYVIVGPTAMNDDPGGRKPIRLLPRARYQAGMAITRDDLATVVIAAAVLPQAANRAFSVANGTAPATTDWWRVFGTLPRE
jgi:uncharacterized protein YbjT (DUF2867 family)